MKGIVTAGGMGTRLLPVTRSVSKQLLPVYDKPMIYYPLATLMQAGVRDILLVSTPADLPQYERLLGDGSAFGTRLTYLPQPRPEGIAQALVLGADYIANEPVALVLGDNVFHGGDTMTAQMQTAVQCAQQEAAATIFGFRVSDPNRYGVMGFGSDNKTLVSIEEKPARPKSNFAVVGLYFYPGDVVEIAQTMRPSGRGEYEITDVNNAYLAQNRLKAERLSGGASWLDTGTHESLLEASNTVEAIEHRQGIKIACLEEIAYRHGWIDQTAVLRQADAMGKTDYADYLRQLV